ncbi:hypothetical protein [Bacillus thuringiensis]|uniref:hypothetical protein n=1 Tax=Bacillus thuringiensis TaxID=1428 RepID=UPI000A3C9829|nr:hypothetical protein [Bacillus thuringiensis]OUA93200.1 hypothetical protein BK706_08265 [Bacillus thuringiensis serovar leesis]
MSKSRIDYIKEYYEQHEKKITLVIPGHPIENGQIRVQEYEYRGIKFSLNVAENVPLQEARELVEAFPYIVSVDSEDEKERGELICQALYQRVQKPKQEVLEDE